MLAQTQPESSIIWRDTQGNVIACVEKNKVMRENLAEIRQSCQDALEDAVLMGCNEAQFRSILSDMLASLINPYPLKDS